MKVFVDLDGTLSDDRWRRDAIPDWDAYHAGIPNDKVRSVVAGIVNDLGVNHEIVILTGRPARFMGPTIDWLNNNDIGWDDISMRGDDDFRPTPEVKLTRVRDVWLCQPGQCLIIDNNQKVADLLRTEGYEVWLVE